MKIWLKGLLAAVINSVASAVTTTIVAPETFNFQDGLSKLGTLCIVSAILGAALYLKQSPLPNGKNPYVLLLALALLATSSCTTVTSSIVEVNTEVIGTTEQGKKALEMICKDAPYQWGFLEGFLGGVALLPTSMVTGAEEIADYCRRLGDLTAYEVGKAVGTYGRIVKDAARGIVVKLQPLTGFALPTGLPF